MTDSKSKDSDGKWTPPPEIPGSIKHLKRELEDRNKRLVAAYDVIEAARMWAGIECMCGLKGPFESMCGLHKALINYDKALEKE